MHDPNENISLLQNRLQNLEFEKSAIIAQIEQAQILLQNDKSKKSPEKTQHFTPEEKIEIFIDLFRGRTDVFPKRWNNLKTGKSGYSPACRNEWVKDKCKKPKIKCGECMNQAFLPVTPDIIRKHLVDKNNAGEKNAYTIGVYPMLLDGTCWFLAVDFDKDHWRRDVTAFIETCHLRNVPFSLERSRSGNGAHIWIFFQQSIPASDARKMGAALLTETMERCPEIGFESYDRFFPSQDNVPSGGFGNLIALPLQCYPRKNGNSLFLDTNFEPYNDQWEYLASIKKMTYNDVIAIVDEATIKGKILGVRLPIDEDNKPWEDKPSTQVKQEFSIDQKLPASISIILSNLLFIEKQDLPPALINKLIRIAAFQNPAFYAAQAMRLSTFDKPRIIACAENFPQYIGLPRGCLEDCIDLLNALEIEVLIDDKRNVGTPLDLNFLGELTQEQEKSAKILLAHDAGVLAATTAFGKTVVASYITAARKTNTLIIVHRRQLLDQWVEKLKVFLNISPNQIGVICGGKRKPSGIIDIAVIQSLVKDHIVDDIVCEYGQVIIDECHHVSAVSFEAVVRASKAKYVLGLSATVSRKDGHHPIIFMQCGPVRYRVDAKKQASLRSFSHQVIVRKTNLSIIEVENKNPAIQQLYAAIATDQDRNQAIFDDVLLALQSGRSPLILTERKEHAVYLAELFSKFCKNVILMIGGQTSGQRKSVNENLASIHDADERLIIATGRYIGEGFDDARLDTLFLTMPISWQGTLAQYAGRLHRAHHNKKDVLIYDYVDSNIASLTRMAAKRMRGYVKLGYTIKENNELLS